MIAGATAAAGTALLIHYHTMTSLTFGGTWLTALGVGLLVMVCTFLPLRVFVWRLTTSITHLTEVVDNMASGNLETIIPPEDLQELQTFRGSLQAMQATLRHQITALHDSDDKLAALFASMAEMVVLHEVVEDDQGRAINYRITDCNAAYTQITGITKDQAVGRLATEVYGTDTPPYLTEFCTVGQSGEPCFFETYFAPMDKYFAISVVSPGPKKFATVSNDISPIKRIQQAITAKNHELEQIVYVTSHDLRSPLVNVDGYGRELEYGLAEITKALEATTAPDGSGAAIGSSAASAPDLLAVVRAVLPDFNEALWHIRNSTRQMDALLKGLLKLSRLGRASLRIDPLDMNDLIPKVLSSFEFQAREAGAVMSCSELPPCRGDAVQVTQIFSNLLGNAIKFLDPARPGIIHVSGHVDGSRSIYCVEDNGIGIAPEHQANIFQLFHRLDPSRTEGEGLGLTIVRQILGRLEGEIWVESAPDDAHSHGSRFHVALPAVQHAERRPKP
jgi:signal transduction histidine kinase